MHKNDFDELMKLEPDFSLFKLDRNPFSIYPLFSDPNDEKSSKRDEYAFEKRSGSEDAVKALGSGRRILVYGDIGVGKSTLLNLLLYLARIKLKYMPVRVYLSENSVERAVQEILYTVCMEIVRQAKLRDPRHPIASLKRWALDKRKSDDFYDYMARLIGIFEEERAASKSTSGQLGVKIGTGAVPGGSLGSAVESSETLETRLKSKVNNLPSKIIEDYFKEMIEAAGKMGFEGIIVGLDEADYIPEIGKVVSMLTVARGIFFVSDREIFVIAASSDLVRKSDVARGVFDSMVSLKPLSSDDLSRILDKRVRLENQSQSIEKIFEPAAISDIHYFSKGLPKDALRLAANSLTEAAIRRKNTVSREEVKAAWKRSTSKITDILEGNELAVFQALEKLGRAYSSTHELQAATRLSRSQLNRILKTLYEREYVRRALVNRAFEYYI